jgi:hypothetical protein
MPLASTEKPHKKLEEMARWVRRLMIRALAISHSLLLGGGFGVGGWTLPEISPINIRSKSLTGHYARRLALDQDAHIRLEPLPHRCGFSKVADRGSTARGEIFSLGFAQGVEVFEKAAHAHILPFSNGNASAFGVLRFGNRSPECSAL